MRHQQAFYPETRFGGFTLVDGTLAFYSRVNALLSPDSVVLDVGCGRGAFGDDPVAYRRALRILKGKCRAVIGLDVDPQASQNPFLDDFRLISDQDWPVESASADLCLADNVLEHIAEPDRFFAEANRALRTGGYLCLRTPNLLSYTGLVSRLVPNRKHVAALQKAKDQLAAQDVFPTFYRCNTLFSLRNAMRSHGFDACVYGYEAEPSYLAFGRFFYLLGVLHQRFAPGMFKVGLQAFGVKMAGSTIT